MLISKLKPTNLLKKTLPSLLFNNPTPTFSFSNTHSNTNTHQHNLKQSISNEINFEKETYKSLNSKDLSKFLLSSNFLLIDNEDSTEMKLVKSTDKYQVVVYFSAKEPVENEDLTGKEFSPKTHETMNINDIDSIHDKFNGDKMKYDNLYEFCVEILRLNDNKQASSQGMYLIGSYFNDNFSVKCLYSGPDADKIHKELLTILPIYSDYYVGPAFSELDVEFQNEFIKFLSEDLGINLQVLKLIEVLSQDKEQRLYMKWLRDVSEFFK